MTTIEIWSDIACPWCYVGKRRLEAALARLPYRDDVEVVWHSFELDPAAPVRSEGEYAARLAAKYGSGIAQARGMIESMTATGAAEGLDLRFDRVRATNTFDAHRLLHLAAERGVQDAVKERLLAAYMTEGELVGDHDTLVRLAGGVGIDADEARRVLAAGDYADAVRADEAEAAALGITGVPFFVVDRRYGVSGAQPAEVLVEVIERARADAGVLTVVGAGAPAPGCEDDSCAV